MAVLADGEQHVVALLARQILTVVSASGTGRVTRAGDPARVIDGTEMFVVGPFDASATYTVIGPAVWAVRTVG